MSEFKPFEKLMRSRYFDGLERTSTANSFFITRSYKWTISISLGIFLFLFMAVFLPFGVSNYDPNHRYTFDFLSTLFLFAIATFMVAVVNEFLLKPRVLKTVNPWSISLWSIWLIISLGATIYVHYNLIGGWHDFSLSSGIDFILNTSSVLIFPIIGTFFFFRYKALKFQFEQVLSNRNQPDDPMALIEFKGQGINEHLSISMKDFLFAKAQDNYVELYFVADQSIQKELLRTTMNSILEDINPQWMIRCHRSFMINLFNVRSLKGGSQLELHLNHISKPIPVSNSYKEDLMKRLKALKRFE